MSFNSNTSPKDSRGNPIVAGKSYEVRRGGSVRVGVVHESPDDLELLVVFEGEEKVQRVDELSQWCTWTPLEESSAQTA